MLFLSQCPFILMQPQPPLIRRVLGGSSFEVISTQSPMDSTSHDEKLPKDDRQVEENAQTRMYYIELTVSKIHDIIMRGTMHSTTPYA